MIKLFKKIGNFYFHDLKLSKKLILTYWMLLAIPTIGITGLLYGQIYDVIVSDTLQSEQALAKQTAGTIEATLGRITSASSVIVQDSFLDGLFRTDLTPSLSDEESSQLNSFLSSTASAIDRELIQDIKIYVDTPMLYLCDDQEKSIFQPLHKNKGTYWHGIFSSTDYTSLLCPTLYLSPSEAARSGNMAYIRKITYSDAPDKAAAYLALYFNQSSLDYILQQDIVNTESVSYIINERDALTATTDTTLSGTYFMNMETLQNSLDAKDTFFKRSINNTDLYVTYHQIQDSDWHLVSFIPAAPLLERGNQMILQFITLYLFFLTLAFILAIFLSRSITSRLSSVIGKMQDVRNGKPSPLEHTHEKDEIGDLIETYNYMTDQIDLLMTKQAEAAENLRISEVKALQSQINPHFLYNTLDMINWLSKSQQSEKVTEAVHALSGFYKLSLSKTTVNTIAQELEHVSFYTLLQNMRFQDRITFLIDVPEDIMDYLIPRLTLQPIVENAIQHGIMEQESKEGNIVITAWMEDSEIVILVSDDGIGMDEDTLKKVLTGSGHSKKGSNIGVYNTHRRLMLLYGKSYGLSYTSSPGQGTEVTIRIPARLEE